MKTKLRKAIARARRLARRSGYDFFVVREGAQLFVLREGSDDFEFWACGMAIIACVEPDGTTHL